MTRPPGCRGATAWHEQIEELQGQIRERAAWKDWDAVVAISDELAALDLAAADPDALVSTARDQITHRQEAERATVGAQHSHPVTTPSPLRDEIEKMIESPLTSSRFVAVQELAA